MLPKAHLTSYSRMSGSRWVITPSWLSGSLRSFLCSSSVYSYHLFLIFWISLRYTYVQASQVGLVVKKLPANAGDIKDLGSIFGSGRSPGGGHSHLSSILAWRIPWTEETSGLWSMGSQSVGHDWSDLACMYTYICPLPLELPSHLPLHPTPLSCRRALGLSSLYHTANSH